MEKMNNNEIVTRRQFFKKATVAALPLMAIAILPNILTSCEIDDPIVYGCTNSCSTSCSNSCGGSCSGKCSSSCTGGCSRSCSGSCVTSCGHACSSTNRRV